MRESIDAEHYRQDIADPGWQLSRRARSALAHMDNGSMDLAGLSMKIVTVAFQAPDSMQMPNIRRIEAHVPGEPNEIADLACTERDGYWQITHVGVNEKWRGNGLGQMMLDHARAELGLVLHSQSATGMSRDGRRWAARVDAAPPLSLELVCGASDVGREHPGWFDPTQSLTHPGQMQVQAMLADDLIDVQVSGHAERGVYYSDAYVRCHPWQLAKVAQILEAAGHPGDILDINDAISAPELELVEQISADQGWTVERRPDLTPLTAPTQACGVSATQIAELKQFITERWNERAQQLGRDEPADLTGACIFATAFAQRILGGQLRGNWHHTYLQMEDGQIIDLTEGAGVREQALERMDLHAQHPSSRSPFFVGPDVDIHQHDPAFLRTSDFMDTWQSVQDRAEQWAQMYSHSLEGHER